MAPLLWSLQTATLLGGIAQAYRGGNSSGVLQLSGDTGRLVEAHRHRNEGQAFAQVEASQKPGPWDDVATENDRLFCFTRGEAGSDSETPLDIADAVWNTLGQVKKVSSGGSEDNPLTCFVAMNEYDQNWASCFGGKAKQDEHGRNHPKAKISDFAEVLRGARGDKEVSDVSVSRDRLCWRVEPDPPHSPQGKLLCTRLEGTPSTWSYALPESSDEKFVAGDGFTYLFEKQSHCQDLSESLSEINACKQLESQVSYRKKGQWGILQLSTGAFYSCAILRDTNHDEGFGHLYCWANKETDGKTFVPCTTVPGVAIGLGGIDDDMAACTGVATMDISGKETCVSKGDGQLTCYLDGSWKPRFPGKFERITAVSMNSQTFCMIGKAMAQTDTAQTKVKVDQRCSYERENHKNQFTADNVEVHCDKGFLEHDWYQTITARWKIVGGGHCGSSSQGELQGELLPFVNYNNPCSLGYYCDEAKSRCRETENSNEKTEFLALEDQKERVLRKYREKCVQGDETNRGFSEVTLKAMIRLYEKAEKNEGKRQTDRKKGITVQEALADFEKRLSEPENLEGKLCNTDKRREVLEAMLRKEKEEKEPQQQQQQQQQNDVDIVKEVGDAEVETKDALVGPSVGEGSQDGVLHHQLSVNTSHFNVRSSEDTAGQQLQQGELDAPPQRSWLLRFLFFCLLAFAVVASGVIGWQWQKFGGQSDNKDDAAGSDVSDEGKEKDDTALVD